MKLPVVRAVRSSLEVVEPPLKTRRSLPPSVEVPVTEASVPSGLKRAVRPCVPFVRNWKSAVLVEVKVAFRVTGVKMSVPAPSFVAGVPGATLPPMVISLVPVGEMAPLPPRMVLAVVHT